MEATGHNGKQPINPRQLAKEVISNLGVFTLLFAMFSGVYFIFNGITQPVLWLLVVPFFMC